MNLVLLTLYDGGHYGQHVDDLVRYWGSHRLTGRLHVVVTPAFEARHADVTARARATVGVAVHLTAPYRVSEALLPRDLRHGQEAARWARRLGADHLVFLYVDHAQLSLGLRLRRGPTRYSGVHFRPSFHYAALNGRPETPRERATSLRKRLILRLVLSNPRLHTLFELDPYAVEPLRRLGRPGAVVALPEPFDVRPGGAPPSVLGAVEPDRRLAVMFGVLDERKGLPVLLDALERLPDATARRLAVVLAGAMDDGERAKLVARVEGVRSRTAAQVLLDERFLADEEIQPLLKRSDLVLLPYVRHVGSSGVLVRAAQAGRPVLTSDYGVLGAHARRHRLGLAVDTTDAGVVARALTAWLDDPGTVPFDPGAAAAFAAANTSETFGATFFGRFFP